MFLFAFTDFIGRFHPLLVHLPIGILLFTIVLQWLSTKEKWAALQTVIPLGYLLGAASAIVSCITGYLLGSAGEYDETVLNLHQWMGILTAFTAIAGYLFSHNQQNLKYIAFSIIVLVSVTGHLGGTLTHGEGYLTKAFTSAGSDSVATKKALTNAQDALVYADVIEPILKEKCYSCHAASKQKGGLRLDNPDWLLKGGKNGAVLKPANALGSELYHRVLLDPIEEKHMPPKGKPQLSERERVLLQWWINTGADFNQPAKALAQTPQIQLALKAMEQASATIDAISNIPASPVNEAPSKVVEGLRSKGMTILTVANNSHYLTANCVNLPTMDPQTLEWLSTLNKQLIVLKMPSMQLKESEWMQLANLRELRQLNLAQSNISNQSIATLKGMIQLNYLNLVDTKVSASAIASLKGLNQLQTLFLAGTKLSAADYALLHKTFPKCCIDTGGYRVPTLITDTQMLKKTIVEGSLK